MKKNMFEGLTDMLETTLDNEETLDISNEVKDLPDDHRTIADQMVEDYDSQDGYVEKQITYPFIEVVGPKTSFEIEHIYRNGQTEEALPLMINLQGVYQSLGSLDLNFNNVLDLLSIAEYKLILHESETDKQEISENLIMTILLT